MYRSRVHCLFLLLLSPLLLAAQDQWPLVLAAEDGRTITIYQPQPESYTDGHFSARGAVSCAVKGKDPVFGAIWTTGFLEVDRETRMGTLTELKVTDIRFPSLTDTASINKWKQYLASEIPKHTQPISVDRLVASLEMEQGKEAPAFNNEPPEIIYSNTPATLVYIDGEPRYQPLEQSGYERMVNTPFFIARAKDKPTLYLGTSDLWYTAAALEGPWDLTTQVPQPVKDAAPKDSSAAPVTKDSTRAAVTPKIFVRTKPAELLQTEGAMDMKPIQGTELLFVTNTEDDIFMHIGVQDYFILLSGRWYMAPSLEKGPWNHVPGDKLPTDFANIPEDSEKGDVLASVPGTTAAREAVLDAQIPQTAKVDRKSTTTTITYDGEPKWKLIEGTTIYEAENASTTVLYIRERYYACESAVWYESDQANGPWKVCTEVPKEVKDIPPSSPSYNVKYVYIYETTPEVVYVGYTPGYMGSYVYGPTVVYGTGFYYNPWYGAMYYPRPCTWGFSMHYNPYMGWSMGIGFSVGFGVGFYGGFWGPPMYRPPYYGYHGHYPAHHHHGGYHGGYHGGHNNINIDNSNNFYGNRGDHGVRPSQPTTRPGSGGSGTARPGNKPSTQPAGGGGTRPGAKPSTRPASNNVLTDKQGNVYRDNGKGGFQQPTQNGKWQNTRPSTGTSNKGPTKGSSMSPGTHDQLNRDMQNRQRGQQRTNNFQQRPAQGGGGWGGGGGSRGGGGGGRGGGGRGGGGRR